MRKIGKREGEKEKALRRPVIGPVEDAESGLVVK